MTAALDASAARRRRAAAALLCAALVLTGGCAPRPTAEVSATADPTVRSIREARDVLGPPVVQLAQEMIRVGQELDAVRHEVGRGTAMQSALDAFEADLHGLQEAAVAARAAVAAVDRTALGVEEATAVVESLSGLAVQQLEAAAVEATGLAWVVEMDLRLQDAVAEWDRPGSQSERRRALTEAADRVDGVAVELEGLFVEPLGCSGLVDNRRRWAAVVAERTRALAATATGSGGARYDALRAEFAAAPFGEDRRVADAADRPCWLAASEVWGAAEQARADVDFVEQLLGA